MTDLQDQTMAETLARMTNDDLGVELKHFVLRALLDRAANALPTREQTSSVLKNFLFEVSAGELRIMATDMELTVIARTPMVDAVRPGTAVFPKTLLEIVREAEDADAKISVKDGVATVAIGKTTWELRLVDGGDYPRIPDTSAVVFHEVDRFKFVHAINSVRLAASQEPTRANMMMIDIAGGKVRATDGARFQQIDLDVPIDVQIPIGAVDALTKILRQSEVPTIKLGDSERFLVFRIGGDEFVAQKMTARFPNVEKMLLTPALANNQELKVDRQALIDAVRHVRITSDPETSAIVLALDTGTLKVFSQDKMGQRCVETMDVGWMGGKRTLCVNWKFLLDQLNMASALQVRYLLGPDKTSKKSALLLKDDEAGTLGIVQQMHADWVTDA